MAVGSDKRPTALGHRRASCQSYWYLVGWRSLSWLRTGCIGGLDGPRVTKHRAARIRGASPRIFPISVPSILSSGSILMPNSGTRMWSFQRRSLANGSTTTGLTMVASPQPVTPNVRVVSQSCDALTWTSRRLEGSPRASGTLAPGRSLGCWAPVEYGSTLEAHPVSHTSQPCHRRQSFAPLGPT